MALIELKPKRARSITSTFDKVKVSYPKTYNKRLNRYAQAIQFHFGAHVANTLGWQDGDMIGISIDDVQPLKWFLKKVDPKYPNAWKLRDIYKNKNTNNKLFQLALTWDENNISPELKDKTTFLSFFVYSGGLFIYFPGCPTEDRMV